VCVCVCVYQEEGIADVNEMLRSERPHADRRLRDVLSELATTCSRYLTLTQSRAAATAARTRLDMERLKMCQREIVRPALLTRPSVRLSVCLCLFICPFFSCERFHVFYHSMSDRNSAAKHRGKCKKSTELLRCLLAKSTLLHFMPRFMGCVKHCSLHACSASGVVLACNLRN